jgi:16S rRNA (cytidine1402-2'-O)-methyltransferase
MLRLVATPIGNLEDITLRAVRVLREADVIAAEDTRHTGRLLKHLEIRRPMLSCHQHNEARRSQEIVGLLSQGKSVALVSDAGTPGISDPGERVVRAVREAGLPVESIPGPCAAVAALSAAGLPTDRFHFAGFLPPKSGKRRKALEQLLRDDSTLVLYESPYRVGKLLGELADLAPDSQVVLARELTKKFEEFLSGTPVELAKTHKDRKWKGEFVAMIRAVRA